MNLLHEILGSLRCSWQTSSQLVLWMTSSLNSLSLKFLKSLLCMVFLGIFDGWWKFFNTRYWTRWSDISTRRLPPFESYLSVSKNMLSISEHYSFYLPNWRNWWPFLRLYIPLFVISNKHSQKRANCFLGLMVDILNAHTYDTNNPPERVIRLIVISVFDMILKYLLDLVSMKRAFDFIFIL